MPNGGYTAAAATTGNPYVIAGAMALDAFGGSSSGGYNTARYHTRRAQWSQQHIARDQMKRAPSAMVEGATAAGLHPLFAMGINGGGSSTQFNMPGQSPSGSHRDLGGAMLEYSRAKDNMSRNKENKRMNDSALKNEELNRQLTQLRIDEIKNKPAAGPEPVPPGTVVVNPREVIARSKTDTSQTAGSEPAWRKVEIIPGLFGYAPASDEGWAEGLEGLIPQIATVVKNSFELSKWLGVQGAQWLQPYADKIYKHYNTKGKKTQSTRSLKSIMQIKQRKRYYGS